MKRSKGLRADPERTRAWQQRSRDKAREREREAPEQPPEPERRRSVTIPAGMRHRVTAPLRGVCAMCLWRADIADVEDMTDAALRMLVRHGTLRAAATMHHVLPQHDYPEHALTEANLLGLCWPCHDEHERWRRRIPRALLRPETLALADAHGLGWYIERNYPA